MSAHGPQHQQPIQPTVKALLRRQKIRVAEHDRPPVAEHTATCSRTRGSMDVTASPGGIPVSVKPSTMSRSDLLGMNRFMHAGLMDHCMMVLNFGPARRHDRCRNKSRRGHDKCQRNDQALEQDNHWYVLREGESAQACLRSRQVFRPNRLTILCVEQDC